MAGLLAKFFGRTASEGAAFALGAATAPVLAPAVEELRNEAWRLHASRALSAGEAAEIVGEYVELREWGANEAAAHGIDGERFDALVEAVRNGPGFGELLRILRRHPDGGDDFRHGLRKARLEERWDALLEDLASERLDPAVIANAIQQGFMENDGILPVTPDQSAGQVPTEPPVNLDTVREAAASGYDRERLKVLARLAGLPPGPQALAAMRFRNIIAASDYSRGVGQGHTKNEWADALLEYARQIPTAAQFVQGHLRGWISEGEMLDGAALHGMAPDDVDLLYKISGRPATTRQAFIGHARGGVYDGPTGQIPDWFLNAVRQSNLRPEWANLLWAQRYTYPSSFVLRALTQAGDISAADADEILRFQGWEPTLAAKVSAKWAGGTGSSSTKTLTVSALRSEYESGFMPEADFRTALKALGYTDADAQALIHLGDYKRVARTRDAIVANAHKGFVSRGMDETRARDLLTQAGMHADSQDAEIAGWTIERESLTAELTDAQIVKAYKKGLLAEPDAIDELTSRGLTEADARIRLQL